jgi:hypothetical protein
MPRRRRRAHAAARRAVTGDREPRRPGGRASPGPCPATRGVAGVRTSTCAEPVLGWQTRSPGCTVPARGSVAVSARASARVGGHRMLPTGGQHHAKQRQQVRASEAGQPTRFPVRTARGRSASATATARSRRTTAYTGLHIVAFLGYTLRSVGMQVAATLVYRLRFEDPNGVVSV